MIRCLPGDAMPASCSLTPTASASPSIDARGDARSGAATAYRRAASGIDVRRADASCRGYGKLRRDSHPDRMP
jgi:hypothetical protein